MWVWGSQGRGMQGLGVFSAEITVPNLQPPWEGGSGAAGAAVGLEGLGISPSPIPHLPIQPPKPPAIKTRSSSPRRLTPSKNLSPFIHDPGARTSRSGAG